MIWKISHIFGNLNVFDDFTMGNPIVKSPKTLRFPKIREIFQNIFPNQEKIYILRKKLMKIVLGQNLGFGGSISVILVNQKFIILQGLHV